MTVIEVNREKARSWTEQWLNAGHAVSAAVLSIAPFHSGIFRTFIGDEVAKEGLPNFESGWAVNVGEARRWLAETLDEQALRGAKCLIVEDDLSRPTDPALLRSDIPSAFIGDRVVSWCDVNPQNGAAAVDRVMYVGSGYPRNAFVVNKSAAELGLIDRQQVSAEFAQQVAASLLAVIVSIFDAESYLVWTPSE